MLKNNIKIEKTRLLRSRLKLVFIISFFIGPLLGAFLWYYGFNAAFVPQGKSNYARLIQPVVTILDFDDQLHDGGHISLENLKHKWTVVHLIGRTCEDQCQRSLYNTRQTRIALGKDVDRVQRFAILENADLASEIRILHSDIVLIKLSKTGIFSQLLAINATHNIESDDGVLIDPLGNVMMAVPVDLEPRKLLKDLKKLLKLSRLG